MIVTATEFKMNFGRYLDLVAEEDIFITRNGRSIARVTSPEVSRVEILDSLVGVISDTAPDEDAIREERLSRQ